MAQVKWVRNNATDKIPSYSDGGPSDLETQSKIIEAIQEEQNRVHKQDQQLLRQLAESDAQKENDGDEDEDEEEEEYEYKKLEDNIIKYICEKIVAMREQPFIDAVDNLRRAQELNNLQMIMDMQKNKQKLSNNLNQHSSNLAAGYGMSSQMSGTTPVDGMSQAQYQKLLMSQYQDVQDAYSVGDEGKNVYNSQNKVTFRGKTTPDAGGQPGTPGQYGATGKEKGAKKAAAKKNDDDDMNKAGRMLKTEKISDICEERFLTRMEVYNIRSQFAGLCQMSKEDEQRAQAELRAAQDGGKSGKGGKKGKGGEGDGQDEGRSLGLGGR